MNIDDVVALYLEYLQYCLPFYVFFTLANMVVRTVCNSAFKGKFEVK